MGAYLKADDGTKGRSAFATHASFEGRGPAEILSRKMKFGVLA